MTFIEWTDQVGVAKVAKLCNVSTDAVYQWRRCETSPKVMVAYQLIEASLGVLDWDAIYMPYVNARINHNDPKQTKLFK